MKPTLAAFAATKSIICDEDQKKRVAIRERGRGVEEVDREVLRGREVDIHNHMEL